MAITAAQVKELRQRTGAAMMECKKALVATDGDIDAAIEAMRKAGQAKADKKASRTAADGAVVTALSDDGRYGIIIEVNCETDFVARDENFSNFVNALAQYALKHKMTDVATLMQQDGGLDNAANFEEARTNLIAKIGENVSVRQIQALEADATIGSYVHGGRIGVLVALKSGSQAIAKDVAMHIAASAPLVVNPDQVSAAAIEKERDIFAAQAAESGKPADIIEKMVTGRVSKFVNEVSLTGQAFVKDPSVNVGKMLKQEGAEVAAFVRFVLGEGIEKEESNFAEEVMAQVNA